MKNDITRRDALALGVSAAALVATGASAQTASAIKAADVPDPKFAIEKGASLRMLRPVRFVPADEEVFRANAARFTAKTGVEVKVDFVGWEDINQQTAVTSNSGAGPDIIIGFSDAPHIYSDKLIETHRRRRLSRQTLRRLAQPRPEIRQAGQGRRLDRAPVRGQRRPADLPQVRPAIGRLTTRRRTTTPATSSSARKLHKAGKPCRLRAGQRRRRRQRLR